MNKQYIIAFVTIMSLLLPLAAITAPAANLKVVEDIQIAPAVQENTVASCGDPAPLLTNVMNNPSFEERYAYGAPMDYSYYGSFGGWGNSTYQDRPYGGTYSGQITGWGSTTSGSYAYLSQVFGAPNPYVTNGIVLDFYYYLEDPGAIDQGAFLNLYVETVNSTWYWQGLNYVFSYGSYIPNNYTSGVYYLMNETASQWNHFRRNITEDYLDYPEFWTGDSTRRINSVYFYSNVPIRVPESSSWVIDDVSMVNGTDYEFVQNGDFESSGSWSQQHYSPADVTTSTDSTDGIYSLNMSCTALAENSNGYASLYERKGYPWESYYPFMPGSMAIEFDWKYSDTWNSGGANAYFRLRFRNESGYYNWYHYLGYDSDYSAFSNTSNNVYTFPDAYGSRNTWEHTYIDVSAAVAEIGWMNLTVYSFRFTMAVGLRANSSVQLLIDDFQVRTYATGDPGFEIDLWDSYSPPMGTWAIWSGVPSYISRSTDSHSGMYACNLTVANGVSAGVFRGDFETTIDPSMYTNFWWRTDTLSSGSSSFAYARFRLQFNSSYEIYYYLARTQSYSPSNSSNNVHIFLDAINTTGVWVNTYRNLTADLEESFGAGEYSLNRFVIEVNAESGESLSVLFDDLGLGDASPPEIAFISHSPVDPMYYETVDVSTTVTDALAGVMCVEVYYRQDGGIWNEATAANVGDIYTATLPISSYGTIVEYYLNATDWTGTFAIDDNLGQFYTYTVDDDIDPMVSLSGAVNGQIVTGNVNLSAVASDIGSGIDYVDFQVDGTSLGQDDTAPYEFTWNTRTVVNGTRIVTALAYDNKGNSVADSFSVDVQNDVAPPELTYSLVTPSEPQYGQPVTISVGVTDVSGITNVTLHYSINGASWNTGLMDSSGALYSAEIAGQPWNTLVEYYIEAYDVFNSSQTLGSAEFPLSFVVTDLIAPELGVSGPSTFDAVRDTVHFQVSATDTGSGMNSIEFRVDGTLVTTTGGNVISWNTLEFENGNYTLEFTAIDEAGNSATFELEYMVHNPVGLEGISEEIGSLMSEYGFFVGAATVVLLYVAVKVLLRRRAGSK